eukprot:TRINITY_DN12473_c0_g1_i1.p2 TRINITY_DN12473_c0_g1~~TRINITY_DN12473_c0_g1_i1.p2  ORF type:complete len:106 (-),score=0.76 TRINITY_DN12473_c0_g1_i1:53-370(-)
MADTQVIVFLQVILNMGCVAGTVFQEGERSITDLCNNQNNYIPYRYIKKGFKNIFRIAQLQYQLNIQIMYFYAFCGVSFKDSIKIHLILLFRVKIYAMNKTKGLQ